MAQNANKGTDLKPSRQSVPEPIPQPVNLSPGADAELTVVGIGASTGGFEAITELLENLPQQTGMASLCSYNALIRNTKASSTP
jgi:chemotaxis response regulator CheB